MDFTKAKDIFNSLKHLDKNEGLPAYDGVYTNDDNSFMWVHYNNLLELEAILTLTRGFDFDTEELEDKPESDWVCIVSSNHSLDMIADPEYNDTLSYTIVILTESKKAINKMLSPLEELTLDRAKILINNLLSEVTDKVWNAPSKDYLPWLKEEVGFTESEIQTLKNEGLFPEPVKSVDEIELD